MVIAVAIAVWLNVNTAADMDAAVDIASEVTMAVAANNAADMKTAVNIAAGIDAGTAVVVAADTTFSHIALRSFSGEISSRDCNPRYTPSR